MSWLDWQFYQIPSAKLYDKLIDEDLLGQLKIVDQFKVTALNLHVIMMRSEIELMILAAIENNVFSNYPSYTRWTNVNLLYFPDSIQQKLLLSKD